MSPLPPPPPPLWAPRVRGWLARWLNRMDRRRARKLAALNQTAVDWQWRRAYTEWWNLHGWSVGAKTPEQVWEDLLRARRMGQ